VDLLVKFELEHIPDFRRMYDIEQELSKLLGGHRVNLGPKGL